MKYRRNKVKREHGIIQDALEWLEELGQNPEVMDIIPGVIEVSRSPARGIVYKYETQTGCKLLLKSNGSIQEAFVVTQKPEFVRKWVEEKFPTEREQSEKKIQNNKTSEKDKLSQNNKTIQSYKSSQNNKPSQKDHTRDRTRREKGSKGFRRQSEAPDNDRNEGGGLFRRT